MSPALPAGSDTVEERLERLWATYTEKPGGVVPLSLYDGPVPLDRVEFSRPVEVATGIFVQTLRFGTPCRTPCGPALDVYAWLDDDVVLLSTGQEIPLAGGLVQLYIRGE